MSTPKQRPEDKYLAPSKLMEESLLVCLIENPREFHRVTIQPAHFSTERWRRVAEVLWGLLQRKAPVDMFLLVDALAKEYPPPFYAEDAGTWVNHLGNLMRHTVGPPASLEAYQTRIRDYYQARRLVEELRTLATGIEAETVQERLATTIKSLMSLAEATPQWTTTNDAMLAGSVDYLDSLVPGRTPGIPTGLTEFDDKLGGFHPSDLVIIAARPSMGKTSLLLNIMDNCGRRVGFISGEQGRLQIGMRRLAMKGGVSLHRMRNASLKDDDWQRISAAGRDLMGRGIFTFDKPGPTIEEIEQQARVWKHNERIEMLLVDYLQKIKNPNGGRDLRERTGNTAARLKDVARELDIPVVCFSQVKREVEERALGPQGLGRMPYMSDIAESGIVEQEADQVVTIYRPGVYDTLNERWKSLAYLNICKNRHGSVGYVQARWIPEFLRFANWEEDADPYSRQRSFA